MYNHRFRHIQKTALILDYPRIFTDEPVPWSRRIVRNCLRNMKVPKLAPPLLIRRHATLSSRLRPVFIPITQEIP